MFYERQAGSALQLRPWTLLVYMVSDEPRNANVPTDGSVDLQRILNLDAILATERRAIIDAAVARPRDLHVAVQVDYLKQDGVFRSVNDGPEHRGTESVSTSQDVLDAFFEWGINMCPAEKYAVLFWGHSSGPSGLFSDDVPSYGFSRAIGQTLDLRTLGECLGRANDQIRRLATANSAKRKDRKLDIILFKDCFQSILETAFELGKTKQPATPASDTELREARAAFMIASQGLIPIATQSDKSLRPRTITPWPYEDLFDQLVQDTDITTTAQKLVARLGEFYLLPENMGEHLEVPITALSLEDVGELVAPLKALQERLALALDDPMESDGVYDALRRAFRGQVDGDPLLVDVQSLCDRLHEMGSRDVTKMTDELTTALKAVVRVHTPSESRFKGLSMYYYPATPEERRGSAIGEVFGAIYKQLRLNQLTGWHNVALAETPSATAQRRVF